MGMTHIILKASHEDVLTGALHTAWKLRVEKNAKTGRKKIAAGQPLIPSKARSKTR
jgi:hypothetical protein